MRVAHVVASYHPRIGGVETHVRRIAEACAVAGDTVTVLTHAAGAAPAVEDAGAVRVLRFPETVRSVRYPLSLPLFRYLASHAGEFEVVHAHSYHTLAGQAAARSGLPFVFTPHYHGTGHTLAASLMHRAYRPVGARLLAGADAIICVSQAERDLVAGDFPAIAKKVRVIPNGTDPRPAVVRRPEPASGLPPVPPPVLPMVLTVGRIERYKNVDLIVRAFAALRTEATLLVVGDGPDRPRVARLAAGVGRVRFTGRVSDAELEALLSAADVVTSASDHEAFGLVVADGLTAGARVVASGIPAHREIGRLAGASAPISYVDPRNTADFAVALDAALAKGRPPAGQAWLPSWREIADQTRDLYAAVAREAGTRSRRARHEEPA
jgi:glycosyltransferase involved in cell wall biosynthesis